jgi:hypothetical protein
MDSGIAEHWFAQFANFERKGSTFKLRLHFALRKETQIASTMCAVTITFRLGDSGKNLNEQFDIVFVALCLVPLL